MIPWPFFDAPMTFPYALFDLNKLNRQTNHQTNHQTDIFIYRAPMEIKIISKFLKQLQKIRLFISLKLIIIIIKISGWKYGVYHSQQLWQDRNLPGLLLSAWNPQGGSGPNLGTRCIRPSTTDFRPFCKSVSILNT